VAGQTLRLAAERTPDSATAKIREIQKVREEIANKKMGGKTAGKLKEELKQGLKEKIAKTKATIKDWNAFLDEIKC
jgi:hypothetical protein